jgi:hypothetical protein
VACIKAIIVYFYNNKMDGTKCENPNKLAKTAKFLIIQDPFKKKEIEGLASPPSGK